MEYALFIGGASNLKKFNGNYKRLYVGNEFCHRLLPEDKELFKSLAHVSKSKTRITLVLPQVNEEGLSRVMQLIKCAKKIKAVDEIVVNDLGIMRYLTKRYPHQTIIAGRLLNKFYCPWQDEGQFKTWRISGVEYDYLRESFSAMRKHSDLPLIKKGGEFIQKKGLRIHMHYPYTVVHVTRHCSLANVFKNDDPNPGIKSCNRECLAIGALKLKAPLFKEMILAGNAQMIKQAYGLKRLEDENISRIIIHPALA